MNKPKTTQMDVAEYLDYIDNMDELEMQKQLELYDRGERYKRYATNVIWVLFTAVVLVATFQLVEG